MTAAILCKREAKLSTYPPLREVPHRIMRLASIDLRSAICEIMLRQSSNCASMDTNSRGRPVLPPQ